MCGRYSLFTPPADLEERFGATFDRSFEPRYNAAPGQELPVVRNDALEKFRFCRWGLVPSWADDPDDGPINARSETVAEKPTFGEAYERRRCLVPADGFYEWTGEAGSKRPYRVRFEDDRTFAMAGIWETWEGVESQVGLDAFGDDGEATPESRTVHTFAVLTTEPNDVIADLHDRMAVILPEDEERRWLTDDDPSDLLEPYPGDEMEAYPVSTAVNDPANDRPELVEPVGH
jgi:putative SOS response-associated peptidase YedK